MLYFFYYFPLGIDVRLRRPVSATWFVAGLCVTGFLLLRLFPALTRLLYQQVVFVPAAPRLMPLLANAYVHGGWIHLLSNLVTLIVFAPALEDRIGPGRFLLLYHACNVVANVVQAALALLAFPATAFAGVVGASGAIAGVMGLVMVRFYFARLRVAYWAFMPLQAYSRAGTARVSVMLAVLLWSLIQIGLLISQSHGAHAQVAVGSHLGGLLAGVTLALLFGLLAQARQERHLERGLGYFRRAEWHAAHGEFTEYVKHCPQDPDGHLQLARALHMIHAKGRASTAYRSVCRMYGAAGRFDLVESVYAEAKRGDGAFVLDPSLQLHLARLLETTMKPDKSQQAFADFAARYPDHVAAPCALFRAAQLAEQTGDASRAHPFYRRLLELYPGSLEAGLADPMFPEPASQSRRSAGLAA